MGYRLQGVVGAAGKTGAGARAPLKVQVAGARGSSHRRCTPARGSRLSTGFSALRLCAQHQRPRERNRSDLGPSPLPSAGQEGEQGSPRGGEGDEGALDASDGS